MADILRAITVGVGAAHPLDDAALRRAAAMLQHARTQAQAAGYEVQTVRVATRPLLADMASASDAELEAYAAFLQATCERMGLGFLSLGPAPADNPSFPLDRLAVLPRVLIPHPALNAAVQLASAEHGIRFGATLPTAQVMRELAAHGGGEHNFRFAALAMCRPGGPFFPQAFADGPEWTLSCGLQGASVVRRALAALAAETDGGIAALADVPARVRDALAAAAMPAVQLFQALAHAEGLRFAGVDLSPAPMGADSIVDALEAAGVGRFGDAGTLALVAAVTAGIRDVELPRCGYNGVMLPVLEDRTLGERCAEGAVSISSLLTCSAICGTGLDTVPISGATPPARLAALLADVATLAWRLRKPLSARLFLVPGAEAGEMTSFTSPYLTNTRVLPLG